MILPIALAKEPVISRFNTGNYLKDVESSAQAALWTYYEIRRLEKQFLELKNNSDKAVKAHNKRLRTKIRALDDDLHRLIKNTDYTVMTLVSYQDHKIIEYSSFNSIRDTIEEPILVRGIAAGRYIDFIQEKGLDYYFIETGYFGNYVSEGNPTARKSWHRIVKNSMQHSGIMDVPDDRLKVLIKNDSRLKWNGWKTTGKNILLVAPSEKPCQYYGIDKDQWIQETYNEIKKYTDRPIVVREKKSRTHRTTSDTIYDAFNKDIFAVVTYNSIAAAEAVSYGIPAFALAPTVADPVVLKDLSKIENPYYPDPEFIYKWLSSIAYNQFHAEEMLTGLAWKMVLENAERPNITC